MYTFLVYQKLLKFHKQSFNIFYHCLISFIFLRFFYENTAPQWHIFNKETWRTVEKYFRERLSEEPLARHIIITGTYGSCSLPNNESVQQPLYLSYNPPGVNVPQYIWKMDFNLETNEGLVFIGLNNPYIKVERNSYICKTIPCPLKFKFKLRRFGSVFKGLVYCCTASSFQETYGILDPLKWKKNLL